MNTQPEHELHSKPGAVACSVSNANPAGGSLPFEVRSRDRWLTAVICIFLTLAVWVVFGQTLHDKFVNYDDARCIYENPAINGGISPRSVAWIFTHKNDSEQWLPLTDISHMADWQLYGANAGGHHLTNVLLHAANAMLLFLLLRMMTGCLWRSAFVASVFAIHPLRVESVAWVTERKDVLSGLFFLLTLVCYVKAVHGDKWRAAGESKPAVGIASCNTCHWSPFYWLALVCFTLGLMSKSMLVSLPFVLLMLDYWPLNRFSPSSSGIPAARQNFRFNLLMEKTPFIVLSAVSCAVTVLTQKDAMLALHNLAFPWRLGNALVAYVDYLWQTIWPVGLAVLYPHPENHLSIMKACLSGLLLVIITAGVMAVWRKWPSLSVGWFWFLGMLVPVIGLLQVGEQARADRYTYLPQIGLMIMAAWGTVGICGSRRYCRVILGLAAAAVFAALMVVARVQTGYWKDSFSLWTHTLAVTSANPSAHSGLGMALADQGKLPEAIQEYEEAIRLKPDLPVAHYNLGVALASQGKLDEAIQHYQRAIQIRPDYPEALNNLGNALGEAGRLPEAVQQFERALQARPDFAEAHFDLGVALARQDKLDEAIPHFQEALALAAAQNNKALDESIRTALKPLLPDLVAPRSP